MSARFGTIIAASLALASALVWAFFAHESLRQWDVMFNSDFAAVGLAYKYVLEKGLRPLFVWDLGYLGTLAEVSLGAVAFKLFGVNPIALNFAPFMYFGGGVAAFYLLLVRAAGRRAAAVGVAALALSGPDIYLACTRSWPNYPSTFLLGLLLWHLYVSWVRRPRILTVVAMGFCAGFGLYQMSLVIYFIVPIVAHVAIWHLGIIYRERGWPAVRQQFDGGRVINTLLAVNCAWALVTLVARVQVITLGAYHIGWNPGSMFVATVVSLGVVAGFRYAPQAISNREHRRAWLACGVGAMIGYAPAIAYRLMGGPTEYKHLALRGTLVDFTRRFDIFLAAHESLWNLPHEQGAMRWLVIVVYATGTAGLGAVAWRAISQWARTGSSPQAALPGTLLVFLFLGIVPLFLFSNAVVDMGSTRYLYALQFFYAAAIGVVGGTPRKILPNVIVCTVLAGLAVNNTRAFQEYFATNRSRQKFQNLIRALDQAQLTRGYADYWYAYSINFLTNERIILEPLYSAHIGAYRGRVARDSGNLAGVAYLVPAVNPLQTVTVTLDDRLYEVSQGVPVPPDGLLYTLKGIATPQSRR